ncbi:DUF3576 domain-containing protein [Varunaivibrio sulfuroxidans]|nr:DUF3576 domain-containing protein [Varunaivibrio sulfuroxidans]WES32214.1 DUF3576 domain-containing protein [Varunaivibrio sulfuroxidans]
MLFSALALSACAGGKVRIPDKSYKRATDMGRVYAPPPSILGEGGLNFGGDKTKNAPGAGTGIAINTFLWRASLDTVAFAPLSSADPFGGVIISDWYAPPKSPNERFKLNIFILGRALRADGIRVSVFRQVRDAAGEWRDAAVPKDAGAKIEDAILTRARQLRQETQRQQ